MAAPCRYAQPNRGTIAAKVIDGEAIMMNLTDGSYYSMLDVGGFIWELIEQGNDLDSIANAIAGRYDVTKAVARADVDALMGDLVAEGIVVLGETPPPPGEPIEPSAAPGSPLPYSKPELQAYRDMQDLLALDPPGPGLLDAN